MDSNTSMISCTVCGTIIPSGAAECTNCGAVIPISAPKQQSARIVEVNKVRQALHSRCKRVQQAAVEKALQQKLKTAKQCLETSDFAGALKIYQAARSPATQLQHAKLIKTLLSLLAESARILIRQQQARASTPKVGARSKSSSRPSKIGRFALIPLFVLAGYGLLGLFSLSSPLFVTRAQPAQHSPVTSTPTAWPTITSSATSLPNPVQIFNSNLDEIQELFHWSAGKEIENLAFSPDGEWIASGDGTGTIKIWQLWTDQFIFELPGNYAAFSPDGKWIATAGPNGVQLFDHLNGGLVRSFDSEHSYYKVEFSPDSQLIVAGKEFDTFFIWRVNDGSQQKGLAGFIWSIQYLSFSQDGVYLAVGSREKAYVWNLQERKIERSADFSSQQSMYYSLTLDDNGKWFATGHENGQIFIWRMTDGKQMARFDSGSRYVHGLQFLHGSNYPEIIVSGDEENLSFWSMEGNTTIVRRQISVSAPILSLSIAPENRLIATGGSDGVIRLWAVIP